MLVYAQKGALMKMLITELVPGDAFVLPDDKPERAGRILIAGGKLAGEKFSAREKVGGEIRFLPLHIEVLKIEL